MRLSTLHFKRIVLLTVSDAEGTVMSMPARGFLGQRRRKSRHTIVPQKRIGGRSRRSINPHCRNKAYMLVGVQGLNPSVVFVVGAGVLGGVIHGMFVKSKKSSRFG